MKCQARIFIDYFGSYSDEEFDTMTMSRASIVVLCYNGLEETTRPCLESIVANTAPDTYELIIVDNGSTDGTVDYLKVFVEQNPHVYLQLNDYNKGYADGNNDGIRIAHGQYVVLLNNDTLVPNGWLEKLLKLFNDQPSIGLIGPVTNSAGNEQRIELTGLNEKNFEEIASSYVERQSGVWFDTERLGFFCVAIRRKVLDKVGLLDENFGIGMFEDDDYCVRAKKARFTLAVVEDCFIYHKGSVTFSKLSGEKYHTLFEKNKAYFREKHKLEWTLTDIAFSYWKKFNHDLQVYVDNNKRITAEMERIISRIENFKHLLLQIHRVELASIPSEIRAVSNHPVLTASKWRRRWYHFKRHMLQGTYAEKKRYLRALPEKLLHRYYLEKNTPFVQEVPVPEAVLYKLNVIRDALRGRKLIIFPATIDFHYMTQRPQHLAQTFAKAGYMVIYGTLNHQVDKVNITEQITDNLYLLHEHYFSYLTYVFKSDMSIYYCLWPNNVKHLAYLPYSYLLYDYMDDLSLLDLPPNELERDHMILLSKANLVTVSADSLMAQLPEDILSKALLVNNAVSQEFIERVGANESISQNILSLEKYSILGYYGVIAEWFDFDLIEKLAEEFLDTRIILIGPVSEGVSQRVATLLWNNSNIVVLPACKQFELIPFLRRFDVCLIPFIKNKITAAVSPVKLFEYLSAGKPVVTSNLAECAKYTSVHIANDHSQFIKMVYNILFDPKVEVDDDAQQIALNNTWQQRVQQIESAMELRSVF